MERSSLRASYENDCFLWSKLEENPKIYVRRFIRQDQNLYDKDGEDNIWFRVVYDSMNRYLLSKIPIRSLHHENIVFENISGSVGKEDDDDNDDDDDDDYHRDEYINGDFKKNCLNLLKNIYAIDFLPGNAISLLMGEIFNVCNVVAFDLSQKVIISLHRGNIYIIFYEKFQYIKLNMNPSTSGYGSPLNLKHFLLDSDMDAIYEYYARKNSLTPYVESKFWRSLLSWVKWPLTFMGMWSSPALPPPPPPPTPYPNSHSNFPFSFSLPRFEYGDDEDGKWQNQKWSHWDDHKDYLEWHMDKDKMTYSRKCVHLRYNLSDIYNMYCAKEKNDQRGVEVIDEDGGRGGGGEEPKKETERDPHTLPVYKDNTNVDKANNNQKVHPNEGRINKTAGVSSSSSSSPLENICEHLFHFNHLYVNHESLITNNVIHIDFKNLTFITLKVIYPNICEFRTLCFLPFYHKDKNGNELMIPFSSYIITMPSLFDFLYYYEYIPGV